MILLGPPIRLPVLPCTSFCAHEPGEAAAALSAGQIEVPTGEDACGCHSVQVFDLGGGTLDVAVLYVPASTVAATGGSGAICMEVNPGVARPGHKSFVFRQFDRVRCCGLEDAARHSKRRVRTSSDS